MKEARIILPVTVSEAAIVATVGKLTHKFGGATVFAGWGHWLEPNGVPLDEGIRIVDVAYEQNPANDAFLYEIAWQFGHDNQQQEVYLRYGNGHVQMVTEKSCMDNGVGDFDTSFGGVLEAVNILTDKNNSLDQRAAAFAFLEGSLPDHEVTVTLAPHPNRPLDAQ